MFVVCVLVSSCCINKVMLDKSKKFESTSKFRAQQGVSVIPARLCVWENNFFARAKITTPARHCFPDRGSRCSHLEGGAATAEPKDNKPSHAHVGYTKLENKQQDKNAPAATAFFFMSDSPDIITHC